MKKLQKMLSFLLILTLIVALNTPTKASAASNKNAIDQTAINNQDLLSYFTNNRNNKEPMIFVHGLFGWGNNELLGINYWGGKGSIKTMLQDAGYTVYTPTIGPIASNWDRACELYAYIVGGTVDYGKAHSEKNGHARYGRTYPGICPELKNAEPHKVHLIGHSMGGETIRALAQLLEQGDSAEQAATGDETSRLFMGNEHWVRSITTLATPHDGSQYDEMTTWMDPAFHDLVVSLAAQCGANPDKAFLDFQMDQWGLVRKQGESANDYYKRILSSKIWGRTTDLSNYDLSLEGAKELNSWVKAQDDIYYFSVSGCDTHTARLTKHQLPNSNMNPLMIKSSIVMGSFTQNRSGKVKVTKEWWANDGIVSVRSAIAPHEGSTDSIRNFDGTMQKGTWNYLGQLQNTDHIEMVGMSQKDHVAALNAFFVNMANMLYSLN